MHNSTTLLAATHGRGMWTIAIREPAVTTLGPGCAGTVGVPLLTATPPRLGTTVTLTCNNLRPGHFALFLVGLSNTSWAGIPLPLDLGVLGMPGCTGYTSGDFITAIVNVGGAAQTTVGLSSNPSGLGFTFYSQVLAQDPGINAFGAVTSNALALTVGN